MRLALFHMRESLKYDLSPTYGTEVAAMIAEAFSVTVVRIAKGIETPRRALREVYSDAAGPFMTGVFTLLGFVAELKTIEHDMEELPRAIVAKACAMIAKQAKAQIGQEHELWPALAASTIADKASHGFATPKPLLRTGELRDSIEWSVFGHGRHVEGAVGSNNDKAVSAGVRHRREFRRAAS